MSVINVTVTNAGAANVSVSNGSTVNATVGNGGAVNVSTGTISPGNATVVSGTLTINSTTTLAAGQQAYVVNNGTAYAAKLDIGIPAGPATLVSVGNTTTLAAGSNATVTGATDGSNLTLSFGIPSGANGVTPAFSIGNVTTGAAGSSASVVATTSNSGANVTLDLTIPRGDPGTSGSNGTNGTSLTLSDATPSALGTASAGTSSTVSRADHTHQLPVISYANLSNVPSNFPTNTTLVSGLSAGYSGINHAHNYVTSLNNLTGALTLAAGSNVTLTANGSTLTLASVGGGIGANDAVDGGSYVGEILGGITFSTQPQSQTVSSNTTVNLSSLNVSTNPPAARVASVGSFLLSTEIIQTYSAGSQFPYGITSYPVRSADNGTTWSRCNATAFVNSGLSDFSGAYRNGVVSAASNGTRTVMTWPKWQYSDSQDLTTWSNCGYEIAQFGQGGAVAWTGTRFSALVVVGSGSFGMSVSPHSSPDGINWTEQSVSESFATVVPKVMLLGNTFYVIGRGGSNYGSLATLSTSNGAAWTHSLLSGSLLSDAASSGSRIVGVNGTLARYTTNGTAWTNVTLPVACDRISYAAGLFWAFNSSASVTDVCTSSDGVAWTLRTLPSSNNWFSAAAAQGGPVFIVGQNLGYARAVLATTTTGTATITSSATAASGNSVSYQWQVSLDAGTTWSDVSGATSSTLSLTGLTTADSGKRYRVSVSATGASTVTSQTAILTVTG